MNFIALQDALRTIVTGKIRAGQLTGVALAQKTGFRQAHVSNFLNRRRGLSIEAMNRILEVLGLTVLDLIDPAEINRPGHDSSTSGGRLYQRLAGRTDGRHRPTRHHPSLRAGNLEVQAKFPSPPAL